jgi:hypothetical protein
MTFDGIHADHTGQRCRNEQVPIRRDGVERRGESGNKKSASQ